MFRLGIVMYYPEWNYIPASGLTRSTSTRGNVREFKRGIIKESTVAVGATRQTALLDPLKGAKQVRPMLLLKGLSVQFHQCEVHSQSIIAISYY